MIILYDYIIYMIILYDYDYIIIYNLMIIDNLLIIDNKKINFILQQ